MVSAAGMVSSAQYVMQKGGPVAWNFPDPIPAYTLDFAVMKKARHPNAAKVFLGWLGSKGFKVRNEINLGRGVPYGGTIRVNVSLFHFREKHCLTVRDLRRR